MAANHGHARINAVAAKIRGPFHPGSLTYYMYVKSTSIVFSRNKPLALFDLQVLAQVFLPSLIPSP